ncbi:MAG: DoxX family membrane protein [Chloroflexia bacterium]
MSKLKTYDLVLAALVAGGFILPVCRRELRLHHRRGAGAGHLAARSSWLARRACSSTTAWSRTRSRWAAPVPQPAISRFLFHDTRAAALWLVARFYVGFQWLEAGFHKVTDANGAWDYGNGAENNQATGRARWLSADRQPQISYDWYRTFLQTLIDNGAQTWFAPLIAWGEVLVGIGLIVGGLVGIAAFFGR